MDVKIKTIEDIKNLKTSTIGTLTLDFDEEYEIFGNIKNLNIDKIIVAKTCNKLPNGLFYNCQIGSIEIKRDTIKDDVNVFENCHIDLFNTDDMSDKVAFSELFNACNFDLIICNNECINEEFCSDNKIDEFVINNGFNDTVINARIIKVNSKQLQNVELNGTAIALNEGLKYAANTGIFCETLFYNCRDLDFAILEDEFGGQVTEIIVGRTVRNLIPCAFMDMRVEKIKFEEGVINLGATVVDSDTNIIGTLPNSIINIRKPAMIQDGSNNPILAIYPSCVENTNGFYHVGNVLIDLDEELYKKSIIMLPDFIEVIGDTTFCNYCGSVVGENVKKVEMYAFSECCIENLVLPKVESIGIKSYNIKNLICGDNLNELETELEMLYGPKKVIYKFDGKILPNGSLLVDNMQSFEEIRDDLYFGDDFTFKEVNMLNKQIETKPYVLPMVKKLVDVKKCHDFDDIELSMEVLLSSDLSKPDEVEYDR